MLKRHAFHASLARYGYDLDDFPFDNAYLDALLARLGKSRETVDLGSFAVGHFNLLFIYIQAKKIEDGLPTIEQETKALAKAQDLARKLAMALGEIQRTGEAGQRLVEDAQALPRTHFSLGDVALADFANGPPYEPFQPMRALLHDLQTALQRAKIEKPRPAIAPLNVPASDQHARDDAWTRFDAFTPDLEARYQARLLQHGRTANSALTAFALELWQFWQKYSDRPFTEGRYEGAIRTNNSNTLDLAETCLKAFGAKYARSLIAKKLRDIREATRDT
jgi:hypothetical protein